MSTYHDVLDTVTAVGTGFGLPLAAWAALQATRAAKTARAQLQSENRPYLLHVPFTPYPDGAREIEVAPAGTATVSGEGDVQIGLSNGTFIVPVRNVGRGPALIRHWRFGVAGSDSPNFVGLAAVPAGERIWLGGKLTDGSPAAKAMASATSASYLMLALHYLDYLKTESQFAVIVLGRSSEEPGRWVAKRTEHELAETAWVPPGERGQLV